MVFRENDAIKYLNKLNVYDSYNFDYMSGGINENSKKIEFDIMKSENNYYKDYFKLYINSDYYGSYTRAEIFKLSVIDYCVVKFFKHRLRTKSINFFIEMELMNSLKREIELDKIL